MVEQPLHSGAWQRTMQGLETARNHRAIAEVIRRPLDPPPGGIVQLRDAMSPLCTLVPELNRYDLGTEEGRREFPRTIAAILNLGIMLRAGDAMEQLNCAAPGSHRFLIAQERLQKEYLRFSSQQSEPSRLTIKQFQDLAALYEPIRKDNVGIRAVALALAYGDLFKLKSITNILHQRLVSADSADHDIALQQAVASENIKMFLDIFPSLSELPPSYQAKVLSEIRACVNLGQLLQVENCPGSLTNLEALATSEVDELRYWLLPTLMDISAARASDEAPASWVGSSLVNRSVCADFLDVAGALQTIATEGAVAFFDKVHATIRQRPYYNLLKEDQFLKDRERNTLYRLSRFFSFETGNRPLAELIAGWHRLTASEQECIHVFFERKGLDAANPKVIVTYLPYIFTQLYAPKCEISKAIDGSIGMMLRVLQAVDDFKWEDRAPVPIRMVAGQAAWFSSLKPLTIENLFPGPSFAVESQGAGAVPELKVQ